MAEIHVPPKSRTSTEPTPTNRASHPPRPPARSGLRHAALIAALLTGLAEWPAMAYHPLSTDDPGTTEFRHFELEWANEFIWPDQDTSDAVGYLAVKSGLAPGLEFDAALDFAYQQYNGEEYVSGWGDTEMLLKYRFFGDGDGPFNLGIEAIAAFPSAEVDKGLAESHEIIPTVFLFGTAGQDQVRVLINAGITVLPDENDTMLYGWGLEWAASEQFALVAEIFGETDFKNGGGNDPSEAIAGALYSPADWITISAGAATALSSDAPDYRFTVATLVGW